MTALLPTPFRDLEGFAGEWALPSERLRNRKRTGSSLEELQAFAAAVGPRVPEIATYLSTFPMGRLPDPERRLLDLAMIYTDVGFALELYRQSVLPESFPLERFDIHDVPLIEDGSPP